ncbi:hypothetical protein PVAP13_3NG015590 [Panicum virgatum]|uniref:Uncharacterized protein n=1 Tax=Panicum virgatum TaxID=38727 RepID=A0A8T0TYM5_PANVG|nr:hypothetical protein PVAP13_3NG015590 [Panicum virgatum]
MAPRSIIASALLSAKRAIGGGGELLGFWGCVVRHGGGEAPVPGEVQGGRRGGGRPQRHDRPCRPDGHGQILRVGPGRAEPGDADAGLHARLLAHLRLRRRPHHLHGPRQARRVRRHVHGRTREGGRHRLPRRHRQATAIGMIDLPQHLSAIVRCLFR